MGPSRPYLVYFIISTSPVPRMWLEIRRDHNASRAELPPLRIMLTLSNGSPYAATRSARASMQVTSANSARNLTRSESIVSVR